VTSALRVPRVWHSAVRFSLAIVVADALVWWLFAEGTAVVMGSFAVICLLYFLDFGGTARQRFAGYLPCGPCAPVRPGSPAAP